MVDSVNGSNLHLQEEGLEANTSSEVSEKGASKLRRAIPQVLASSAKNLFIIGYGMTVGFTTIAIPALKKENNCDLCLSDEEISWFGSINLICVPIGGVLCGPILNFVGRRQMMMVDNIPFIATWILYYFSKSSSMLYAGLILSGLGGGFMEAPVITYAVEITEPHLRGVLTALSLLSIVLGIFIEFLLGTFIYWRTVAIVSLAVPIVAMIAICFVPESPPWLLSKGREDEAMRSLCWLRGWVEPSEVQEEFQLLSESIKSKSPPKTWQQKGHEFFKPTVYKPFFVSIFCFLLQHFAGLTVVQTYAVEIFKQLDTDLNEFMATMLVGLFEVIGSTACVILVHWTGKRALYLAAASGSALCMLAAGTYAYLHLVMGVTENWAPLVFIIGFAFISHTGLRGLHWIFIGEIFPLNVRAYMSGITVSIGYILGFIANKTYLYIVNGCGLYGIFWMSAGVGILGTVVLYFFLPETEGKSMIEIGTIYEDKRNTCRES